MKIARTFAARNAWTALSTAGLVALAVSSPGQTLLYQWNFDNAAGSGSTFNTAPSGGSGSLGTLTNLNLGSGPSAPAGSGLTGAPGDLALVQPTYGVAGAGAVGGPLGNLSGISGFTASLWFNLNATANNFGAYGSAGALNPRLIDIANTANGDGNRLYFALNTGTNLQFGVNNAGSTGPVTGQQGTTSGVFGLFGNAPATMTNNWIFVAASYTTALNGTVNLYVGSQAVAASLVGSLTNVGAIAWDSAGDFVYVGNRPSNGNRAMPGSIDDMRIYDGAGDQPFIQTIQGIPEPGGVTLLGFGCLFVVTWFRRRRS